MRLSRWVLAIAAGQLTVLLATASRYGYDRDELYFIVAGSHPALGYPDQPPFVPLLCSALHAISPSLTLLRTPSALASAATVVLAAVIARELGGARPAQLTAAACTAVSGFALAVGHFVTTTTFDMLSTTAALWLLVRAVLRGSGPSLLAAGVVPASALHPRGRRRRCSRRVRRTTTRPSAQRHRRDTAAHRAALTLRGSRRLAARTRTRHAPTPPPAAR